MTRLTRFGRISGRATESRHRAPGRALAAALAAAFAVLASGGAGSVAPIGAAFAQTAGTAGPMPTGDWHGTIKKTAKGGGHNHTVDIDFGFDIDPSGMLKGRAHARITTAEGEVPGCTMLWIYSPREFEIPLSGRRDGESFEIKLEPGTITATIEVRSCGEGGGQSGTSSQPTPLYPVQEYRISAQDGATNTVDSTQGALPWGVVMRDTITLHRTNCMVDCRKKNGCPEDPKQRTYQNFDACQAAGRCMEQKCQ
jgi:hypothetical protein